MTYLRRDRRHKLTIVLMLIHILAVPQSNSFHRPLLFPSDALFTESGLPRPPPEVQFPASIDRHRRRKQSPRKWPARGSIHPRSGCSLAKKNIDRDGQSSLVRDLMKENSYPTTCMQQYSCQAQLGRTPLECRPRLVLLQINFSSITAWGCV